VIEAGHSERHYWADVWRFRELLYSLARRDVAVRYKQTVIGLAWAVIRPVGIMLVFTFIFGRIARLPSEGAPYSLLVFTGMVPWLFFASTLADSSNSLVASSNLISKIYFPRILVPLSSAAVPLVDFLVSSAVLVLMLLFLGVPVSPRWIVLPAFVVLALACALGLGIWFAALNVKYRDFQFIVPFLLLLGIYVSPIGFASTIIPEQWRSVYALNPMVGVIEGFRWALLGGEFALRPDALILSIVIALGFIAIGVWYFRRTERSMADVI
jgi:lipopolysaccharide transport system permease protein